MARLLLVAGAALALLSVAPVAAQPTPLKIDANKGWKHRPTGIQFPVTLSGLTRTEMAEYTGNGAELAAQYEDAANYRTEGRGLFVGLRLADRRSSP